MSGHSHAKTIKHQKEITDKKRGQIFSKLSRIISVAAKKGGGPKTNPALRIAIEKAKAANMPAANIERAVKRGAGELEGAKLEEFVFEAMGPGNIGIIIEGITDNKNRTLNEIKQILRENKGKLAQAGSVSWLFERKGVITLRITNEYEYTNKDKEELELKAIEAGAEDLRREEDSLEVITKMQDLEKVKNKLEKEGVKIESVSLDWIEKNPLQVSEKIRENCEKLFEALDGSDDVQEIYSNLKV